MLGHKGVSLVNNKGLDWIIDILESNDIPYLLCGGVAAIAYGSKRKLNDIDVFVPEDRFNDVIAFGAPYISYGPQRYKDQHWDVYYVQFIVDGQKIEVGSDKDVRIYDCINGKWIPLKPDFKSFERISVLGHMAKVMSLGELIGYKSKLAREVDKIDISEINLT